MKTILIVLAALLLPALGQAQKSADLTSGPQLKLQKPAAAASKAVVDTLFPDILLDTCSQTVTAYGISQSIGGFVIGSNDYGDLIKVQRIVANTDEPFVVTGMVVAFAGYDQGIEDTHLRAVVYNDLNADSTFGDFLGASDSVRVGDVALPSNQQLGFTEFKFSTPVLVENDSFFIGIDFSDTYTGSEESYIGLFHTRDTCGDGRNVYESYIDIAEDTIYSSVFENWEGLNVEIFMLVATDTDINTSVRQPVADYSASVSPNPTAGRTLIRFTADDPTARYATTLTDLTGRQLRQQVLDRPSYQAQVEWSLNDLPAGIYLFHIDGPRGRQSGKVIVR